MITLSNISASYGTHPVITQLSLHLARGERVALVGPNGAGKSSLLKILSGQLSAHGSVQIANHESARLTPRARAKLLSVVPQDISKEIPLTAKAFVMLGRTAWLPRFGAPSTADQEAVHEAMTLTGTWSLRERLVPEMSGGERQRLALALTLAGRPEILLLDEPTSHLDLRHSADLMCLLTKLTRERQMTILMAVHDLTLASQYFSRIVLLSEGRKVADGTPRAVLCPERLTPVYGCAVQVTVLPDQQTTCVLADSSHDT